MTHEDLTMDPEVRRAVLKLFHANEKFRQAYADWMKAPEGSTEKVLKRVDEAERSVDKALVEASQAQRRALTHSGSDKTFQPKLP